MRRILALVALTVSLSACGSVGETGEAGQQPAPAAAPVTAVTPAPIASPAQTAAEPLPLTAYITTREQRHAVVKAYFVLVNRCMTAAGFPARTYPKGNSQSQPPSWRYGINDLAVAATYGYHTPQQYQPDKAKAEERPMSAEEEQAFSGGDTEGCVGAAQRQLGKRDNDNFADDQLAQSLSVLSYDQSHKDSRVAAVISQWRTCMRTAGFAATDPVAPGQRRHDTGTLHKGDCHREGGRAMQATNGPVRRMARRRDRLPEVDDRRERRRARGGSPQRSHRRAGGVSALTARLTILLVTGEQGRAP